MGGEIMKFPSTTTYMIKTYIYYLFPKEILSFFPLSLEEVDAFPLVSLTPMISTKSR
jgi:hypothetical protein